MSRRGAYAQSPSSAATRVVARIPISWPIWCREERRGLGLTITYCCNARRAPIFHCIGSPKEQNIMAHLSVKEIISLVLSLTWLAAAGEIPGHAAQGPDLKPEKNVLEVAIAAYGSLYLPLLVGAA